MWLWIHHLTTPQHCFRWCRRLKPVFAGLFLICLMVGTVQALLLAPADYQQGDVYRIMYIHVPAAVLSLLCYGLMTVSVILNIIWHFSVADIIARVTAPLGAVFTALTLVTGSLWGKPTWGAYWVWDARLTSELILLFLYVGIMVLRWVLPQGRQGAKACGIVTIMGCVNLPIIHYSVQWWHTLHQGSTVLQFAKPTIASSMLTPLLWMFGFYLMFTVWWLMIQCEREILLLKRDTRWVKCWLQGERLC